MARYVKHKCCDCCGKPFDGPRYKLAQMVEHRVGHYTTRGFARFYCPDCMNEVQAAIYEHEKWARVEKEALCAQ